jgi:branched-chain amino acid transport system substrate-binding protein
MNLKLQAPLLFLATLAASSEARAADPWIIGIIAPTTGPVATVGLRQLSSVQWWEREVNAKGGIKGRPVQIVSCNDEGSPEKSVTCAHDLLTKGSVLLIDSSVTGPIRAVMPLVQNGPVMLTPSPNVIPDAKADPNVFQTSPTDHDITEAIAAYLKENHADKIAMIAATDASGEVGVNSANAIFPPAGIKLSLARIDLRANDASIQLANVAKSDVPLIYSNYSGGGAAAVVKSYANLGLTQPLLVSYANISDPFIAIVKDDLPPRLLGTGLKSAAPGMLTNPKGIARLAEFEKSYQEWKHERPDSLNVQGLTLADMAEAILTKVADPTNAASVRDFLEHNPIESTQTERFTPDRHIGLGADDMAVLEYKNGNWMKAGPL